MDDFAGYIDGRIQFKALIQFDGPGGYEYTVSGKTFDPARQADLFAPRSGRIRWMRLTSLEGWNLHVDSLR
jgi:hypothetical protein